MKILRRTALLTLVSAMLASIITLVRYERADSRTPAPVNLEVRHGRLWLIYQPNRKVGARYWRLSP